MQLWFSIRLVSAKTAFFDEAAIVDMVFLSEGLFPSMNLVLLMALFFADTISLDESVVADETFLSEHYFH
jgi:hypothetical protein